MARGGVDAALIVPEGLFGKGGGGKSKRPPMDSEPGMMGDEDMGGDEGDGEFDVAAEEFLDDALPLESRKAALKRAIMACMGEDY